jgi:hypothetical protein
MTPPTPIDHNVALYGVQEAGKTPDKHMVAYPLCCGAPTVLRHAGWYCAVCLRYQVFAYVTQEESRL